MNENGMAMDAQANFARQQSQNVSRPGSGVAPVNGDGMALPTGATPEEENADADLGEQWVMKNSEKPKLWSFFADVSGFYTSNVALTRKPEFSDSFLVASVGVNYARPIGKNWNFNAGLSETFFRYNTFTDFDFNSLNVGFGLSTVLQPLWGTVAAFQYNFNWMTHDIGSNELFNGHTFALSANKSFRLTTADSLTFGVGGSYNLADPSSLQRVDTTIFATYSIALTRNLGFSANYRFGYFNYFNTPRYDWSNSLTGSLHYDINHWFSVNFSISGTWNDSNEEEYRYKSMNLGGGLTGTIRF